MQVVLGSAKADPVDPGLDVSLQFSRKRTVMPDVLVSSYLGLVNSDNCLVRFDGHHGTLSTQHSSSDPSSSVLDFCMVLFPEKHLVPWRIWAITWSQVSGDVSSQVLELLCFREP